MRRETIGILLLALAASATACVEGRPAPDDTTMVSIDTGLEFVFGDDDLCQSASSAADNEVTCEDIRANEALGAFQLSKAYPTVRVVLKPFAIDIHEVTNVQYQYCVESGDCTELKGFNAANITDYYRNRIYDDHPVLNVTWEQAKAYCASIGKRLPTQFEWERVAGGPAQSFAEKRRYPWDGESARVQECEGQPIAVAYCGADRDPIGVMASSFDRITEGTTTVYGLAGNVGEWVIDFRVDDFTCRADLPSTCRDCWNCAGDTACTQLCFDCAPCFDDEGGQCYALCRGPNATGSGEVGYPVCYAYEEPLYCAVNAEGESECCLGGFADDGGTDCTVATSTDRSRQFRGGSYLTTDTQTCTMRSGDRSQAKASNDPQQRVGFRCAQSL